MEPNIVYVLQEQRRGEGPWIDLYLKPTLQLAKHLLNHWENTIGPARIVKRTIVTTTTDEVVE